MNAMKRLMIITVSSVLMLCMYGRIYNCDSIGYEDDYYIAPFGRDNCPQDSIYSIYTYAVVKDTFLIDLIIDKVNSIIEDDSVYNSICDLHYNPFFRIHGRNREIKNWEISTRCKKGLPINENDINEKLIPEGFDREILYKKLLTVSVALTFYDFMSPQFYTRYKGRTYYFSDTILITPTNKKKKVMESTDYDWFQMYNFIQLHFFFYNDELHLDPTIGVWGCYQ